MKTQNEAAPDSSSALEANIDLEDDLRPEYDAWALKNGVRGKYMAQYRSGTNLGLLAPDVAKAFPIDAAPGSRLTSLPLWDHHCGSV